MSEPSRIFTLFLDITGLGALLQASEAAHYWLSATVMLRALAALWLIVCTTAFSVRAVRVALPRLSLPLRWSAILGLGTWVATMSFHVLRGLTLFQLPAALVGCSALFALTVYVEPSRAPWLWALRRELRGLLATLRLFRRSKYGFVSAVFAVPVTLLGMRSLIVPPLGWDTLTYHGPRMVHWLQTNQFTFDPGPGPYSFYRGFLSGGEVLVAWACLPFHSDLLANLVGIVQWLGIGAASWGMARALGVREPFASSSAALVMFIPVLTLEMSSGYVEPPLNLALMIGIALAVYGFQRPHGSVLVAAAMSLGVAAGVKLPGAPPGFIVLAALLLRFLFARSIALERRLSFAGLALLGAALPILPWTYQAFIATGYPLSPMPLKLLGITLGVPSPAMEWYQVHPELQPYSWDAETRALRMLFSDVAPNDPGLGPSLGVTALIPLFVSSIGLLWLLRRRFWLALALAGAMSAPWLTHFSSGLSVPRLCFPVSVARYMIMLLGIAIPLSFLWCKPTSSLAQTYRRTLLMLGLWLIGMSMTFGMAVWETRELLLVGFGTLIAGTLIELTLRSTNRLWWQRLALCAVIACVGCSALQLRRDQTRPLAYATSKALHGVWDYWASAVQFVEEPGVEHRIALTGGPWQNSDNWFYYFFFGSRFQNTVHYVIPTADGQVAFLGPLGDLDQRADPERWLERIKMQGITEVLTYRPRSLEQAWMDARPQQFQKLIGDDSYGLYRVTRP